MSDDAATFDSKARAVSALVKLVEMPEYTNTPLQVVEIEFQDGEDEDDYGDA